MKNIDKAIEAFEEAAELSKEFMNTDAYLAPILAVLNHQKAKIEEESEFDGLEAEEILIIKERRKEEVSDRLQAEAAERFKTLRFVKVEELETGEMEIEKTVVGETETEVKPIVNVVEPAVLPVSLPVIPVIESKAKKTYKKKVKVEAVAS